MQDLIQQPTRMARIKIGGKNEITMELREGESALVGSAAGCQLRLDDETVASHQCLLELKDGALLLHNWSDDQSTLVSGTAIEEGVELELNDSVTFGDYLLRFEFEDPEPTDVSVFVEEFEIVETTEEIPHEPVTESAPACVESSTMAILHSEIEYLQRELEQRDQQLAEAGSHKEDIDDSASHALEGRIQELTKELELADARRLNLMDEIQALEELRYAENEERRQLTVWVNEIEQLIAKREEELRIEMRTIQDKLDQERADRLEAQKRADSNASGTESVKQTLGKLREDHETVCRQLELSQKRNEKLYREFVKLRDANTESAIEKRVHDAVRAERLQIAQERATISRKEHLLIRKLREAEILVEKNSRIESGPSVQDLRETITEVEPPKATMAGRLVQLWDRLDGPTDRD